MSRLIRLGHEPLASGSCRACGSRAFATWFTLGDQPLANAFLHERDEYEPRYPLTVQRCTDCGLSQLTHVVDPDLLYRHYTYVSGASKSWHTHCQGLVAVVQEHLPKAKFVVDIASNDGTLLSHFERGGFQVLGIDPAENIHHSVPTLPAYWNEPTASMVVDDYRHADVIVAQNVLGHVDDAYGFLKGVRAALAPAGVAFIEVPDILSLLAGNAFDTIYHEHLSYWSLGPLQYIADRAGLIVTHVDHLTIHGGSLRVWLRRHGVPDETVQHRLSVEHNAELLTSIPYTQFSQRVDITLKRLRDILETLDSQGNVIWGFGAPAKGNVLLNELHHRGAPLPEVLIDDAPTKQGLFAPGTRIPVIPPADLRAVDVLMVLPWNMEQDIRERATALNFRGRFLTPLPQPRLT